jgi:hypothetical protein
MGLGIIITAGAQPVQLPDPVWVEVSERAGETTTYRLRYDFDISAGDFPLLTDAQLDAGSELSVIVPLAGQQTCLVKGPVTGQQIHFVHGGSGSHVEVLGADTSILMDREFKTALWADQTDSDAVRSILDQYHRYKLDVDPTPAGHFASKHGLVQCESDLGFVRARARRNGFLFWLTCDETGTETAHFKRPVLQGTPALNLDLNLATNNLAALDLSWDLERPTSALASQLNLNDKSVIDGRVAQSPLATLGAMSLAAITKQTHSVHLLAPVDDAGDLRARGEGALIEAGWFVRATCQTSAHALGAILRAHTLINLRGVGRRHSGKYFVAAVRHVIDPAAHHMEIELARNGWGN